MATTLQSVPTAQIETVWKETFTSESINQRFRGLGRGIRHGFVPAIGAANDELELDVDARTTDSVAEVGGTGGQSDITIQVREPAQVSLDLTALAADDYYIGIRPGYTTGLTTTAEYVAYTLAEVQGGTPKVEGSTLLCRVTTTGNSGPLTDISLADKNFIRDDIRLTEPRTYSGLLDQVSGIDFGSGSNLFSYSSPVSQGPHVGSTGGGALIATPTSAGQSVQVLLSDQPVPIQQGRKLYATLRYQSNSSINSLLSSITFVELDEVGESVGTTNVSLGDTSGLWVTERAGFEPTSALTRSVFVRALLVSSAASPFYLDSASLYIERFNDPSLEREVSPYDTRVSRDFRSLDPLLLPIRVGRSNTDQDLVLSRLDGSSTLVLVNDNVGVVNPVVKGTYPSTVFTVRSGTAQFPELTLISPDRASSFTQGVGTPTGDYFDFDDGTNVYRVWFNVFDVEDGNSAPPVTTEVLLEVPIRQHWREAQVASAISYVINSSAALALSSPPSLRLFNSDLTLEGVGLRLGNETNITFLDGFLDRNVVLETSKTAGSLIPGSVDVRSGDSKGYGSWIAANLPLAHGLVRYDHPNLIFELDSPDNTSGLNTSFVASGVGTDATRSQFTVQLDTSIPVQEEGLHVQVSCAVDVTGSGTIGSQAILPMWSVNYTSSTNVRITITLIDPTTGNPTAFGATEDDIAISVTVYGRRVD